MKKLIKPTEVGGVFEAPASKSVAQRVIAMATMANGRSKILNAGTCNDVKTVIDVCRLLGAKIEGDDKKMFIDGGRLRSFLPLNCGESGLCARMFLAIASTLNHKVALHGEGSLLKRPMGFMVDGLRQLGVMCSSKDDFLPISVCGPMRGGEITIDGSHSSQVLTGLLMATPLSSKSTLIHVENLKSQPYVNLTIDLMRQFGVEVQREGDSKFFINAPQVYNSCNIMVEGDWSAAAFLLVSGAIAGGIEVKNISTNTKQADVEIIKALIYAGANVSIRENSVFVEKNKLEGFCFDATNCPDLIPPLVALAAHCEGKSKILGVNRLRFKESDRAIALAKEFDKMGIGVDMDDDLMIINGSEVKSAQLISHNDHRIAMACTVAALAGTEPVEIDGAESVDKSYPDFWGVMKGLGAIVH